MKATHALLAAAVAQQAAATWNLFAKPLTSPNYNNNECSDKQKAGFDWSDLKDGDSNFQYGDFDFSSGWKCTSSLGKRDALTKRTFGNKAITNKCSKQKPASFGCNKRKDGFSITTIDVSVEFDVEVDLHYTMNDGSLCKQKSVPCKKQGSTIQNTQCGGAKSVDVYLGSRYTGQKSDCEIGLHHIGFDCNPGKQYTPPAAPQPPSPPPPSSSSTSTPPAPNSCNGGYGQGCPPVVTPPVNPPPMATPPVQTPPMSMPYSAISRPPYANTSAHAPPPPPPTYETTKIPPSPPSQESHSAMPPPCNEGYGGSCGTSSTATAMPSPPSPPPQSSVGTPGSSPSAPSPPPQPSHPTSPPVKDGDVPPQLPSCMNTWLQISTEDCKDNTAVDCYCKNSKFTKQVIDCVQAWCETDEQTKKALQYLVGICAQYVPENPGLVSDCPNDTFSPPSAPSGGIGSSAALLPSPAPNSPPVAGSPVTTIVYGSTSLTVPQVHFTTQTPVAGATPTSPVGLVVGDAPSPTPATTTPAPYPMPSTLRPTTVRPTGTGAVRPSSPAEFTGAASPFKVDARHAVLGAVFAFFAL